MTKQPAPALIDLSVLEELHETKRVEALKALEALSIARRHAILQLQKPQILFKYLNWKQQERIEAMSGGNFSLQKMHSLSAFDRLEFTEESAAPVLLERTASYLQRIKTTRKNILLFDIVQARAGELIEALVKSTAVFNAQYRAASRELYPLGFISKIRRSIRRFFDHPYFLWQELGCLGNLGAAAGFVLKMAKAPVLEGRRQW